MKVVFVSRFPADPENPRGGVETATMSLAQALLTAGVDNLHIVSPTIEVREPQVSTFGGITIHRLPRSRWPMILDVFGGPTTHRIRQYLEQLQPSIVHFHETWGFSAPDCGWPAIFTVHGFDSLNLPTEAASGWHIRSPLWRVAEAVAMRRQEYIISIAPYVREKIEPLTRARIFDIWNALSEELFDLKRMERLEEPRLLFLGWISPRKNPLTIVEATALVKDRFPSLRVELCGEVSHESYGAALQRRITDLGLDETVSVPGRQSQLAVREKLQRASVLVLPALQENAPMVIAEAMAAGVPTVASDLCGIPDMVENGRSGILLSNPHNPEELANAIDQLLADPTRRLAMGRAARERAYELFHPNNVAARTLDAYEQAIKNDIRIRATTSSEKP